ncbi:ABC transporter ATP-binding protein/permease [Sphingomonas donggukensis]|uniref:ABC transporter ATP-binding protein/permease n=1 Tax=Sphingomonas donggukensis TaxID=2949093 RepID=A0ABY4TRY9_9SPHN|nr:ABC transporter ATP-binding protein [Sphingomonas donggukensis]URW75165.1 ABC transporter ATP-binding protein/permease [Sphingomonas donggukensis]
MTDAPRGTIATARLFVGDVAAYAGRRGAVALALMAAGGVLEGVGLAMLVPMLAVLTGQASGRFAGVLDDAFAIVGAGDMTARLGVLLGIFAALIALRAVVMAWRDAILSDLQLGFVEGRRAQLVATLAAARWIDIVGLRHARVTHALSSEVSRLSAAIHLMLQVLIAAFLLAVQTVLVVLLSPAMAAIGLASVVIGFVVLVPATRRASRMGLAMSRGSFRMLDSSGQFLGGLKMAIAQNMAPAFAAESNAIGVRLTEQLRAYQRYQTRIGLVSSSAIALIGAALAFAGVAIGIPTVTLIATLAVLGRMSGPVRTLQQNLQQFVSLLPSYDTLCVLESDLARSRGGSDDSSAAAMPGGTVTFDRVGFTHPGAAAPTLHDVSLAIAPGEIVGIVGASGAGKTSFVDILAGLFEPDEGQVRIGGIPLTHANSTAWRARIAYVAQDPYLLNESLRRNLSWGMGEVDDAALWQALAVAGADALVRSMPDALDTVVAERGSRLSGGERQRIAIARALVRAPELLILDEATNAIDVATERAVLDAVVAARPGMTIILVAHRAETLAICRRLLTFAGGTLAGDTRC